MPAPPRPPPIQVTQVTHQSAELSWQQYHSRLSAALNENEDGKLKTEVQMRKSPSGSGQQWEIVYIGFDTKCWCRELQASENYEVKFRFGNRSGWSEFSEAKIFTTGRKPFTGEDIHRLLRRQSEQELRKVLETGEANVNAPDERGFTPLMQAAISDRVQFCELLVEFGADIHWCGDSGKTSLMLACYKGSRDSVEFLLDNGASPNGRDRKGMTCLHYAVDGEKSDVVKLLASRGADVHARDASGCSPLLRCSMLKNNGNAAIARLLLQAGANAEDADSSGQSVLFYCALHKHMKLAEMLLQFGANPESKNHQGVTVTSVAATHDSRVMLNLLEKAAEAAKKKNKHK